MYYRDAEKCNDLDYKVPDGDWMKRDREMDN